MGEGEVGGGGGEEELWAGGGCVGRHPRTSPAKLRSLNPHNLQSLRTPKAQPVHSTVGVSIITNTLVPQRDIVNYLYICILLFRASNWAGRFPRCFRLAL